jgi:hypothetical protein
MSHVVCYFNLLMFPIYFYIPQEKETLFLLLFFFQVKKYSLEKKRYSNILQLKTFFLYARGFILKKLIRNMSGKNKEIKESIEQTYFSCVFFLHKLAQEIK